MRALLGMTRVDFVTYAKNNADEIIKLAASRYTPDPRAELTPARAMEVAHVLARAQLDELSMPGLAHHALYRCAIYNPEGGIENAILFVPPTMKQWHRVDDAIDFLEERQIIGVPQSGRYAAPVEYEPRNRFTPLTDPLYPFNRSSPPSSIAAMCHYLKVPDLFAQIHEATYVFWT